MADEPSKKKRLSKIETLQQELATLRATQAQTQLLNPDNEAEFARLVLWKNYLPERLFPTAISYCGNWINVQRREKTINANSISPILQPRLPKMNAGYNFRHKS